ncbi:MAG: alanine--glyoxylate aminotransferase family protein [SAR324 cluster bacterium]|nr:alanine--glyoxylate aminotransferase family protein [SAR324 cluster bacterium]MBF0350358.1 alanine--glyoxylate aminotransferase family protein [SAR324 cluster bacterium]
MTIPMLPPETQSLANILPSEPLLLMGAGPVPLPAAVSRANGVVINHLGETMDEVIRRVKSMARYAFQTQSDKILGVSGPSSAAMEMAIGNLLWPGRKVLVLKIGIFSGRFGEMATGIGADVTVLEMPTATPVDVQKVEDELKRQHYDVVTMVQGETSCGVLNNVPEIAKLAKKHGALVIVDAVCTLTTMPMFMDEWGIDATITGGQKGLSSIPGVSLIAFSSEAWEVLEKRTAVRPHWCLDALRAQKFWGHQQYHYTAPVPGILATHEALRLICEETLEKRFERHFMSSRALQAGIEGMGLELFVPSEYRLNSVIAIKIPDGVDGNKVRKYMAKRFLVEISGSFGLNIVRIGQMGEQCRSHNLFKTLYAMGVSFMAEGVKMEVGAGMAALEKNLVRDLEHLVD